MPTSTACARAFDDAELRGDTGLLHRLLADDFGSIGERGYQLDKRQWIDRHAEFTYDESGHRRAGRTALRPRRDRAVRAAQSVHLARTADDRGGPGDQTWVELDDGWRLDRHPVQTSQTLTFIPASTRPPASQKAMNSPAAGSPRKTTWS